MSDDVWPVQGEVGSLSTFNGIGYELKGFTRTDPSGRCFATRWWVVLLPLLPLERYYVTEKEMTADAVGWTTHYLIHGQSYLRIGEIVRTYLFCWLIGPAMALGPSLGLAALMIEVVDASFNVPFWVIVVTIVGGFIGSFCIVSLLLMTYRKRWAPLRTVRWVEGPPTHKDSS
ncbi:hypothetical protein [Actinomadura rubrisoli]|uniref:Uncharacterized protein n=1 Tax=Actinomadura rubrisoli TaxID=2530368 RepID=A0A4R5C414_9ACTN|nr:hypothetical protein [Actinomadura rubrisoli]TDD93329.1 hypothetical protein E1298_10105 [Actinomadura rubrisoli]